MPLEARPPVAPDPAQLGPQSHTPEHQIRFEIRSILNVMAWLAWTRAITFFYNSRTLGGEKSQWGGVLGAPALARHRSTRTCVRSSVGCVFQRQPSRRIHSFTSRKRVGILNSSRLL